ncbi:MAG: hypothetical protein AB7E85_07465 [Pseudobdellovibrionaceae bacterium]
MFSRIDPIFRTFIRQTENTDTRQEIRREENVYVGRDREERRHARDHDDLWTDSTDVSVKALISFLENILSEDSRSGQEKSFSSMADQMTDTPEEDAASSEFASGEDEPVYRPSAARAASAYATTATKIEGGATSAAAGTPSGGISSEPAEAVVLEHQDRRMIENLVRGLRQLDRDGVETLTMSRAGTFFESLSEAIRTASLMSR